MTARILDGKRIADALLDDLAARVQARVDVGRARPGLAVILVGEDPASAVYVRNKRRACKKVGIKAYDYDLPADTGDADIAYSLNPDLAASVMEDPNLQLIEGPTLAIQYLAFNLNPERGGPVSNQQARQAMLYAINYDSIIENILLGAAVRPALPIPLPLPGSEAMLEKAYTYDPERAQQLWDESGVGEVEIEITYDSDSVGEGGVNLETLATAIKSDLEAIEGLTVRLAPLPGVERIGNFRAGDFQATISPWTPDYPDVDTFATPFFRTDTAAARRVGFSNPEVDALLDQGLAETDPEAREAIYQQIQELVLPVSPYAVLYQPTDRKPASIAVQDVTVHPMYILNLRNASKTE